MSSGGGESVGNAASDLASRIQGRFGVLPNFFRLGPETPEITRSSGDSLKPPTSTIRCHPYLRNVFSSTCRAFVRCATALPATLVSW